MSSAPSESVEEQMRISHIDVEENTTERAALAMNILVRLYVSPSSKPNYRTFLWREGGNLLHRQLRSNCHHSIEPSELIQFPATGHSEQHKVDPYMKYCAVCGAFNADK